MGFLAPAAARNDLNVIETIEYHAVARLVIDPTNAAILYAATDGGVLKSMNGGECWTVASDGLDRVSVSVLAFDPDAPTTLYAGTYDGGVFTSTDAAKSWNPINSGLDSHQVLDLAAGRGGTTFLYAATSRGVFKKSARDGAWHRADKGIPSDVNAHVVAVDPKESGTVYVGVLTGLFKSQDHGETWHESSNGITSGWGPGASIHALAIDPETPSILYAGTNGGGAFRSTTGGVHWRAINTGLSTTFLHEGRPTEVLAAIVTALSIDPRTPKTLYAGTQDGIFKTTDGGDHWSPLQIPEGNFRSVVFDAATPSTIYTNGAGVLKSTDGGDHWQPTNAICGHHSDRKQ